MCSHVDDKLVRLDESFVTKGALVRPLSCVNPHVSVQFMGMFKYCMTDSAMIGLLLCVYPQVD